MERATGYSLRERFALHEQAFRQRWANPKGMSLLHGDLNPTNVLTPSGHEGPPYFLDRQPFDWSLTYGVAASDLAYFMIPWWPEQERDKSLDRIPEQCRTCPSSAVNSRLQENGRTGG